MGTSNPTSYFSRTLSDLLIRFPLRSLRSLR
jgi:hypothetical protein